MKDLVQLAITSFNGISCLVVNHPHFLFSSTGLFVSQNLDVDHERLKCRHLIENVNNTN